LEELHDLRGAIPRSWLCLLEAQAASGHATRSICPSVP
jgi:hypothetical protein